MKLRSINDERYSVALRRPQYEEHGPPLDPWGDAMEPYGED